MGLNFIYKTAKPHSKACRDEVRRASTDLFGGPGTVDRTYLAPVLELGLLKPGDAVSVRYVKGRVLVYKDLRLGAEIDKPTMELQESLNACHGILPGQIEEAYELAHTVAVHVGPRKDE
jgi:hypothetical protein